MTVLLLTIATVVALWVLLLVLVIGLYVIFERLRTVRRSLEKIAFGVRAIEKETDMLAGVNTLNGGMTALLGGLRSVAGHFTAVLKNLVPIANAISKPQGS